MDNAAFESYIASLRESRKTPREHELERELNRIAAKHREAMVAESAPIFKELADIEARKAPLPIMIGDEVFALDQGRRT
jgi:hypothetical protein